LEGGANYYLYPMGSLRRQFDVLHRTRQASGGRLLAKGEREEGRIGTKELCIKE